MSSCGDVFHAVVEARVRGLCTVWAISPTEQLVPFDLSQQGILLRLSCRSEGSCTAKVCLPGPLSCMIYRLYVILALIYL